MFFMAMMISWRGGGALIRIAICDDEKHMSDHIRAMASDFFP